MSRVDRLISGTYSVNGDIVRMVTSDGSVLLGAFIGNSLTVSGPAFSGQEFRRIR